MYPGGEHELKFEIQNSKDLARRAGAAISGLAGSNIPMKLFLLRHGKADWPDWKGPDDERPLTEEGIADMKLVAGALKRLKVTPDLVLSSPLPRALRTAEIAAAALGAPVEHRVELKPGFSRRQCDALLAGCPGYDVMIVGHEPDFSRLIRSLTGGRVKFSKAATAAVELGDEMPAAHLLWLFPAKALIRLYG
jgi:phosphohistidine phosphatase